ncbi:DUF397 domain-containing protein [Streptomyces sp. MS19]|uniref:DUF397 domain-containing protein n=1 Tax=Streptomyces sp. MS19 TaxID=3385972 RepID=UPI00399EFB8F
MTTENRRGGNAPDFLGATWKKSKRSGSESQCVEVSDMISPHAGIAIRDSKNPDGPALLLDSSAFRAFITDVCRS